MQTGSHFHFHMCNNLYKNVYVTLQTGLKFIFCWQGFSHSWHEFVDSLYLTEVVIL